MAKADGLVRPAEVAAFREVFQIAPEDEAAAARVFNLARQDVAGFETYASRIAAMFRDRPPCSRTSSRAFPRRARRRPLPRGRGGLPPTRSPAFRRPSQGLRAIESRHLEGRRRTPGRSSASPATPTRHRARWRQLVRTHHPDKMIARGLPAETVKLANARIAAINRAWEEIASRRAPAPAA